MTIHATDLKLRASVVMADVPEGGGGPGAGTINWGESNTVFDDVDQISRTVGNVSIRQLHGHVDTANTDRLLGGYAVIAKGPEDEKVNVTLASCAPFDRRTAIQTAIANYLIRGTQWNGFLLENHVQGQGNIQLFQRPGARKPTIGRTLVLVLNEGQPNEQIQYVRVIKVESEVRTFTYTSGGNPIDYDAEVVTCELQSPLAYAWPGSEPSRQFTPQAGKTTVRDTTEADAANYYGMSRLAYAAAINDLSLRVDSVYSQLVPNSQTSVPALDQRPAARRTVVLAESPRLVEVGITPHTYRIKIGQENRGLSFVAQATPPPAPGTVVIMWVGLGNRYYIEDDGSGALRGDGAGTVNYATGSIALTLPSLPDVGSAIVYHWGTRQAYTNRSAQGAAIRAPEMSWIADGDDDEQIKPGTLVIQYTSDNTLRTVTDNGGGKLAGDGTGGVDYRTRRITLRPTHMPDPAAQMSIDYDTEARVVDVITSYTTPSESGMTTFALSQEPTPGTVSIHWLTKRRIRTSAGGTIMTKEPAPAMPPEVPPQQMAPEVPDSYTPPLVTYQGTVDVSWPRITAIHRA